MNNQKKHKHLNQVFTERLTRATQHQPMPAWVGAINGQNKVFRERAEILGSVVLDLAHTKAGDDPTHTKTLAAMSEFQSAAALIKALNSPASVKDSSIISRIKTYLQSLQVAEDVTMEDWYGPEMKEARRQHLFCQTYFTRNLIHSSAIPSG